MHIYLGPYRGNPIALYLRRTGRAGCQIGRALIHGMTNGGGLYPNKAADFEEKWKGKGL